MNICPMLTDMNHPWVKEVRNIASATAGRMVSLAGHREAWISLCCQVTGLPACCFGIGRRTQSNAHADDEISE